MQVIDKKLSKEHLYTCKKKKERREEMTQVSVKQEIQDVRKR